ncbi:hypothetical protein [Bradyrhizobium elkanii]|uniref:hypothetical protein n=1 Tax=Bradyrhizobium elkanii TaxID=29448 RepID=UPI00271500AC|nr:hypothetical protein [Bradyrhizobium elkanii]WLA50758.1 hypothetical protein QIH80_11585 [Bradyrhizobium elkanii]WLB79004.1 hypothetical protein QIH83_32430 [Bradyrhizobium elkanii]
MTATFAVLIAGSVLLLALSVVFAYRMGFREGREQGLSESYLLYGSTRRMSENGEINKQGAEKSAAR